MIALLSGLAMAAIPVDFDETSGAHGTALMEIENSVNVGVAGGYTWEAERQIRVEGLWTTPLFLLDKPVNHRVELAVSVGLAQWGAWAVTGRGFAAVHHVDAVTHRSTGLPLGVSAAFGPHGSHWLAELQAGGSFVPTSHIRQNDAYLDLFPEARDGWYGGMGGWWDFAVGGGWRPVRPVSFLLSAGIETTMRGRAPFPPYDFAVPWTARFQVRIAGPDASP